MSLDAIDTDRSSSHLASFDEDPVLARVQASLASSGGDVSAMSVGGGSGGGGTGQEMMMAMLAAKTAEPAPSGLGNYHSEQGSSAGPAIAAGIAGLAIGAGVGALIAGSGGDDTTAEAASEPAAPAPAPQAKTPPAATTQPAPATPAAKAPSKPVSTPAAPAKPETKPAAAPVPTASANPDLGLLPDMIQGPKTDRNGNVIWSSGASAPAKLARAPRPAATQPAATASTSAFRLQVTPLPAIPSPDEEAAGASLPLPVASTGPTEPAADPTQADISILYQ